QVPQEVARTRAMQVDHGHVRDIEHAGIATHRVMLLDLRAVTDRHVPATEIDHPRAERAVGGVEYGLFGHRGGAWQSECTLSPPASGNPSHAATTHSIASVILLDAGQQLRGELFGQLLGAMAAAEQVDIRRLGPFIRRIDTSEVADLAGPRLAIQALGIAPLAFLQRGVDEDLQELA